MCAYAYGMHLVAGTGRRPMWHARQTNETNHEPNRDGAESGPLSSLWLRFALASLVLAASGALLGHSGIALSRYSGLSETFVGALLTGVASSMPELVTAVAAVRIGALTLAISNIIGGNTFDAVIVALADLSYLPGSIYADAGSQLMLLLAVALV